MLRSNHIKLERASVVHNPGDVHNDNGDVEQRKGDHDYNVEHD